MATTSLFVTLPVNDIDASTSFYTALGYTLNPLYSGENSACVVLSDSLYIMLGSKSHVAALTDRELLDPGSQVQVLHALEVESREEVDDLADKAAAAGGVALEPQDFGFMYARDIHDPDGHGWQLTWMDPAAAETGTPDE
ncbi:VOC family protein [Subtercola sp. YIM 133946]|uniref:VOC family protein n=1 Tax=Subtercola sp. YIM 133946 TaxID=3118909 RepID=UPI002F948B43